MDGPAHMHGASTAGEPASSSLFQRLLHGGKRFFWLFLYLWILFALFSLHESVVLAKHDIAYQPFGLAFINAWVLAKVMMVADEMNLGARWFERHPLLYRILSRALLFALVLIGVHGVETVLIGLWRGQSFTESLPELSGQSVLTLISRTLILTVALVPFFAFKALDQALGTGTLRSLLLARRSIDSSSGTAAPPPER
jgi:hypothetical protein